MDGDSNDVALTIDYCGEIYTVAPDHPFTIGRAGDLRVDTNPFLHRRLVQLAFLDGMWWISNVGDMIAVTVSDAASLTHTVLTSGQAIPVAHRETVLRFSAQRTNYEVLLRLPDGLVRRPEAVVRPLDTAPAAYEELTTTPLVTFTAKQRRCVAALCEPVLRRGGTGASEIPTAAQAATRLGVTERAFNRQLDAVCEKLAAAGVRGLHGGPDDRATNRRARVVEYVLGTGLITEADLALTDAIDD